MSIANPDDYRLEIDGIIAYSPQDSTLTDQGNYSPEVSATYSYDEWFNPEQKEM